MLPTPPRKDAFDGKSLHEAARIWADLGWRIFPLLPNSKTAVDPRDSKIIDPKYPFKYPDTDEFDVLGIRHSWLLEVPPSRFAMINHASCDPRQIDQWWGEENPNYNIAVAAGQHGLAILDEEFPGAEAETGWKGDNVLPETFTVRTVREGHNRYYATGRHGIVLGNSAIAHRLHLYTAQIHMYSRLPPSTVEGGVYQIVDDRSFAPIPDWLVEMFVDDRPTEIAYLQDLGKVTGNAGCIAKSIVQKLYLCGVPAIEVLPLMRQHLQYAPFNELFRSFIRREIKHRYQGKNEPPWGRHKSCW